MRRSTKITLLFTAIGGLLWSGTAMAQGVTTAAVSGRVMNPAGEPIVGAQVVVTRVATGVNQGTLTNQDGRYFIPGLIPGTYNVSAQSFGFAPARHDSVHFSLGQNVRVDFRLAERVLELAGIDVVGSANPVFSPSRTGAGTVIGEVALSRLPTLGRSFTDFAVLSPLVHVTGEAPSVGGANARFNNIQIDGAVNNDVFGLAASGVPGGQAYGKPITLEAIQEYQVLVAPFDVRQSGFSGGLINAITKSGTNEIRGSLFSHYRNEGMVGRLDGRAFDDFTVVQYGFSLGGPIIRDRLHFFTAGEYESYNRPTAFGSEDPAARIGVLPETIEAIRTAARAHDLDPGEAGSYTLRNPKINLFAKLDFQINRNHRLTVTQKYDRAVDDDPPGRGGSTFEFSSATYAFRSRTSTTGLQLFSRLGSRLHNELLVNVQSIRDRRDPFVHYGAISVRTDNVINGVNRRTTIGFGAETYSHRNQLDQDIVQLTNNLTGTFGAHKLVLGANAELYEFRNLFVPTAYGRWQFGSLAEFAAGTPYAYEINLPQPGRDDIAARFSVLQLGAYLQDEWTVSPRLTLTGGLRIDVPYTLDEPYDNTDFAAAFGISTTEVPSGNPLISPRFGFNYQRGDGARTQVRGGVGVFSGRIPYVWLSNAFGNTGKEMVLLSCSAGNVPAFDPRDPPTQCADGAGPAHSPATVNIIDPDFRYAQDLKLNLAIDRELPFGFTGTLEGIFTKAINQIHIEEVNLLGAQAVANPASTVGIGERTIYGTPIHDVDFGWDPVRHSAEFRNVVRLRNTSDNYSYAISAELQRPFGTVFLARGAYTYARAFDTQSLTSSIATSNYGYNPIGASIDDRPTTPSDFDRPHKVVLSGMATLFPRFGGTEVSLVYVGQSGRHYSYTYNGDINGDGYQGVGIYGRNNDLVYVPRDATDPAEIVMATPADAQLLEQLIRLDPCLRESRGRILERNACQGPWTNQLDLRLAQQLPSITGLPGNARLSLDVINFLNLVNRDWGIQKGPGHNIITLLDLEGRQGGDPTAPMVFSFDPTTHLDEDGNAGLPHTKFNTSSRWQINLGIRYSF